MRVKAVKPTQQLLLDIALLAIRSAWPEALVRALRDEDTGDLLARIFQTPQDATLCVEEWRAGAFESFNFCAVISIKVDVDAEAKVAVCGEQCECGGPARMAEIAAGIEKAVFGADSRSRIQFKEARP